MLFTLLFQRTISSLSSSTSALLSPSNNCLSHFPENGSNQRHRGTSSASAQPPPPTLSCVTRTQPCFLPQPTLPLWPLPHRLLESITLATQLLLSSSVFPWLAHSEGVVSFLHPVLYLIIIITPSGSYDFPNFTNEKKSL